MRPAKDLADHLCDLLPRLHRRARRLTGNSQEAEDMAQETFLRLWQLCCEGGSIDAPERYAMIILHNLARARWRKRQATEEFSDEMLEDMPRAPARIACVELRAAIDRLPAPQAALMRLVIEGETSPAALPEARGPSPPR